MPPIEAPTTTTGRPPSPASATAAATSWRSRSPSVQIPEEQPWPRASYASTSNPQSCRAAATAISSWLSLVAARPCTSTTAARASPMADQVRTASSTPSPVVNMVMLCRSVLRARPSSAGGSRDDRNVVISQRLLEPHRGRPDGGSHEHHAADGLGGHEGANGLAHEQGDGDDGIGQVHERPEQGDADEHPLHTGKTHDLGLEGHEIVGQALGQGAAGGHREEEGSGDGDRGQAGLEEVDEHAAAGESGHRAGRDPERAQDQDAGNALAGNDPADDRAPRPGEGGDQRPPDASRPEERIEEDEGDDGRLDEMGHRMAGHGPKTGDLHPGGHASLSVSSGPA